MPHIGSWVPIARGRVVQPTASSLAERLAAVTRSNIRFGGRCRGLWEPTFGDRHGALPGYRGRLEDVWPFDYTTRIVVVQLHRTLRQRTATLRRDLPGFRDVSLYRICPALSLYAHAGLSVAGLRRGLDDYLAAAGRTWLTSWRPDQAQEQARYLIGMLTRARLAGYIRLPDPRVDQGNSG